MTSARVPCKLSQLLIRFIAVAQRVLVDVLLRNQTPNPFGLIGEKQTTRIPPFKDEGQRRFLAQYRVSSPWPRDSGHPVPDRRQR